MTKYLAGSTIPDDYLLKQEVLDARAFVGKTPTTSDRATQLQAALDAAKQLGSQGGLLIMPPWPLYVSEPMIQESFTEVRGILGVSKVIVGAGSNCGAWQSARYEEGGEGGGTEKLGLFGVEFDGNFAQNPGVLEPCVALDGIRTRVGYIEVKNGVVNFHTTMSRDWSPGTEKLEDGFFLHIGLKDPQKENGILEGPHDSEFEHFLARSNAESFANIVTGGTAMVVGNSHCYGNAKYPWQVGSGELRNCVGEGGRKAQVALIGDAHALRDCKFFSAGGADGKVGIKFGDATHTAFSSQIEAVRIEDCINGVFDFTEATGSNSRISGWAGGASGVDCLGSPASSILWDMQYSGGVQFATGTGAGTLTELASANELELPTNARRRSTRPTVIKVTGAAEIKKMKVVPPAGNILICVMSSTAKWVDGENLILEGNFEGAANRVIQLLSDGTKMIEMTRRSP